MSGAVLSTRCLYAALLAAGTLARADVVHAPAVQPEPLLWKSPDAKVRYELLPPRDGLPAGALLDGEVDASGTRLRTRVRIDAVAGSGPAAGVDAAVDLPPAGPLQGLVVGDTTTTGAAWSAPARLTGIRLGRAAAQRTGPAPVDPVPLQAGATDYELEAGRLREGWDTPDRVYGASYASSAYRAGLGFGLTAQARAEWGGTLAAHGIELVQELGGGATLQALAARSTGLDADGERWGAALVVPGDRMRWRLVYGAANRNFRSATGGAEVREGLTLETGLQLRDWTAQASVSRSLAWDATEAASTVSLGGKVPLARRVQLELDLSRTVGPAPDVRAGVKLALPLE